jgi:hypothetical protein
MSQTTIDVQAIAQIELEQYLEKQAFIIAPTCKIKAAISKTEIDSVSDVFGALYRVWNGTRLLGTFYENLQGKWIAQPCNRENFRPVLNTPAQAQLVIVASWLQD